jgi:hypothetical protein
MESCLRKRLGRIRHSDQLGWHVSGLLLNERLGPTEDLFSRRIPNLPTPRELKSITRSFADWLYYHSRLALTRHPELDILRRLGGP